MIALLRGLIAVRAEAHVVVDVQGVGYRVFMPGPYVRSYTAGEEVTLHIHTHVREDLIQLFGFPTELERRIFLRLRSVKGIGPKLAMAVLGDATIPELLSAVAGGDHKRLTRIPGLGKKTAERILVDLRETFADLLPEVPTADGASAAPGAAAAGDDGVFTDIASALGNLGFKPAQIDKALDALRAEQRFVGAGFDVLFREAMKHVR